MTIKTATTRFIRFCQPDMLDASPDERFKASSLVVVNLTLIVVVGLLKCAELFILPEVENWLFTGIMLGIASLFIFKKWDNFILSGNLLAGFCCLILVNVILQSGGLHARDLAWLIICPMLALFFANRRSGLIWLLGIVGFLIFLLIFNNLFRNGVGKNFSEAYSFLSFSSLFAVLYIIILISKNAQQLSFDLLNRQKEILEKQNVLLEEQNKLLEYQKNEIKTQNVDLISIEERLRMTNQELENFAFAATHDLKEPLRMISMYTQITQRKLRPLLDSATTEYMWFITEGVGRMQKLLDDLLQYSRLGKQKEDLRTVNLNDTLFAVIHNLTATMQENDASIAAETLPTVQASAVEMTQLFQNLIANAIKFRQKNAVPNVEIRVAEGADAFEFRFSDNGIGISSQYHERVFNIFERLNPRAEYEGSGIGLATCKRIVLSAGGNIWLDSTVGVGTTFFFTLPKNCSN